MIYLLALLTVLMAALLAYGAVALMHLHGLPLILAATAIVLLGVAASVVILVLHLRAQRRQAADGAGAGGDRDLDVLLDDANRKLRTAQHPGPKSLDALPLLYILGAAGSAKTTTVVRSGLDPELLAGSAPRDGELAPTPLLNLWFSRQLAILEVGDAVRQSASLLNRMIARTRPRAYRSIFGSRSPSRAAVVCVSAEEFLVGGNASALLTSARTIGAQLRQISRVLGSALPVYVFITKLDRVSHFTEFVGNLSNDEARQVLGTTVARNEASAGVYADRATGMLTTLLDQITFSLAEFRVEMLSRETEPKNAPGVYEFPREFGKLHKNLCQYLVELCKPSHLSANPYLRGFYFTGVRPIIVDEVGAAPAPLVNVDNGLAATQMLSQQDLVARRSGVQPVKHPKRVSQWAFLPRLFPDIILGDKSVLSATRETAPARLLRRILFASLAVVFAFCTLLFFVSYLNNSALEDQVIAASRALNSATPNPTALPALDQLRRKIVQLDGFQRNGPPLSYRFGLYQGEKLAIKARQIYFAHFRPMLLNTAQANIAGFLRNLPNSPLPGADYSAAYNPLKAYLMTTSCPKKSVPVFLAPLLVQSWSRTAAVDPAQSELADLQFEFYANELLSRDPYSIDPDSNSVDHARAYLGRFGALPRIYQDMLAAADKANKDGVNFNQQYRTASVAIVEPHLVRGAFTSAGFASMQNAMQHPDRYFKGDTWVLGDQAASSLDTASVSKQLAALYSGDYIREWYVFLTSARFVGCVPLREAPARLSLLAGSDSPILELLFTVSSNTAVADPQIKTIFQPVQSLIDPNAPNHFIGPPNKPYVDALLQLSLAVNQFNQSPDTSKDSLNTAVSSANLVVEQTAQSFNADPQIHVDNAVTGLLNAPIHCITPPPLPGPPANTCTVLGKFPFVQLPKAQTTRELTANEQASLDDVNALLAPTTGKFWTYYDQNLKQWLVPQGTQYVATPNAEGHVGPLFAKFFTHAARISSVLYSSGSAAAGFSFVLHAVSGKGIQNATLVVDGQRISDDSTVGQFKWDASSAHQASLSYNGIDTLEKRGTWALFQLVSTANVSRNGSGLDLEFPVQVSGSPTYLPDGTPVVVRFELTGPGADVLAPQALSAQPCIMSVVK